MFFLLGGQLSELVMPSFIGIVINFLQKEEYDKIGPFCLSLFGVVVLAGICVFFRAAIFNIMSERIARNLRKDFYDSLVNKDITFYDEQRTGELCKYPFL